MSLFNFEPILPWHILCVCVLSYNTEPVAFVVILYYSCVRVYSSEDEKQNTLTTLNHRPQPKLITCSCPLHFVACTQSLVVRVAMIKQGPRSR